MPIPKRQHVAARAALSLYLDIRGMYSDSGGHD